MSAEIRGVKERLAKLNGKVAASEEKVRQLLVEQARRENSCPVADRMTSAAKKRLVPLEAYLLGQKAVADHERVG